MAFFVDPERPLKPRGHAIRLNQSWRRYVTTDIDVSGGSRDDRRVDRSNCSISTDRAMHEHKSGATSARSWRNDHHAQSTRLERARAERT
jgi:hypothetical protein